MTEIRRKSEISAAERKEIFHDGFDADVDAGQTLGQLLRATGDYLAALLGEDVAAEAMELALRRVFGPRRGTLEGDWRAWIEAEDSRIYSDTPLGARLHDLAAYAEFGISFAPVEEDDGAWIGARVEEVNDLVARSPLDLWLGPDRSEALERLALLARNRWALDQGRPVEAAALALFGGVTPGRMRNLTTGSARLFNAENGRVPALEALRWLEGRDSFWPSVWQEQPLDPVTDAGGAVLAEPVFVPVARDESVFHPGLERGGGFTIGPKGAERKLESFDAALADLQSMVAPYWRRPNETGAWGIVRGIDWRRLERSELEQIARMSSAPA